MSTTAFSLSDFNAALKQVIQPYIQNNIPQQTKLLQVLRTNDNVQFFNNNFYAPVRTNRHGGVTNLANEKSKVVTGSAPTSQASVSPKILTGTFDISDVVAKASANDKGAVEGAMTFQMRTLKSDFAKSANRQYFSDGVGIIAETALSGGSVGAGTIAVTVPGTASNAIDGRATNYYGTVNNDLKPTKYFAAGQVVGGGSAGTAIGTITTVTGGTAQGTLVVTGAPAITAGWPLYILDGDADPAGTIEIQGIRLALGEGTGNYAGVARTASDVWSPQYLGTAGASALTINNMEVVYMSAFEFAQEGDRYAWFMNRSLYTKFGDLLTALRRTTNKIELVSGWSGLAFEAGQGEVAVMLDFDTPDGEAVLLNLDTWTVCEVAPMGFVEDNALRRADYITFQKVFSWYTNLLCVAPAANGRMVRQTR